MTKDAKYYRDIMYNSWNKVYKTKEKSMKNLIKEYDTFVKQVEKYLYNAASQGESRTTFTISILNRDCDTQINEMRDKVKIIKYLYSFNKGFRTEIQELMFSVMITIDWGDDE